MKGKLRPVFKFLVWSVATLAVLVIAGVITAYVIFQRYDRRAAQFDLQKIDAVAERSAIVDARGEHYSYFGGENRLVVPLSAVSKHFTDALLAREDARFWQHEGVDWRGVVRAAVKNFRAGATKEGASTITQQLARNACDLKARTMDRKALEAALAYRIEKSYSKEQILEMYVNRIYFGGNYHGIEAAARGYFGKPAAELSLAEAATLAALIRNPKKLSPRNQVEEAWAARNVVVDRMRELKLVSEEEALAAKAQQIKLAQVNSMKATDDDITDAVLQELETLIARESIQFGGLKVHMTIDPQMQRLAQSVADRRLTEIEEAKGYTHPKKRDFVPAGEGEKEQKPTDYLQAALVAIDNRTGAIRAAVGGRDYSQSKYSRVLSAKRQVGSTFKPFVYAAAFERGMLPGTMIDDSQIRPGEFKDLPKNWSPENSDGEYGGPTPAALGLVKSRNTMSVRVGEIAGLAKVRDLAIDAGISEDIPNYPVLFLGGFDATVKDLAAAYTVFPNLGTRRTPYLISKIEDRDGNVLWRAPADEKKVIAPETAWMVSSILQEVMKSGTASKAHSLGWKKLGAGKTGTTNDFHDAWFVGYTSSLTCAVWVGLDQPQTIMAKGYGSALALPVWIDFMQQVQEKEYPAGPFTPPSPAAKVALCSVSGARATSVCVAQGCAYDATLPEARIPTTTCQTHPETVTPEVAPATIVRATPSPMPIAVGPSSSSDPRLAPATSVPALPPPVAEYVPAQPAAADGQVVSDRDVIVDPRMTAFDSPRGPATYVVPSRTRARPVLNQRRPVSTATVEELPPATPFPDRRTVEVRRATPVQESAPRDEEIERPTRRGNRNVSPAAGDDEAPMPRGTVIIRRSAPSPADAAAPQPAPEQPKPTRRKFQLFGGDDDDDDDDDRDD